MAALAEVFAKQLSPPLTDLYWEACKSLAIEQFQESAKSWIKIGKHFPKPADLLERFKEMALAAPKPTIEVLPEQKLAIRKVNGLFLKYLAQRRVANDDAGDLNIEARRGECLRLIEWIDQWTPEELKAEGEEIKRLFDIAMARVQDKAA